MIAFFVLNIYFSFCMYAFQLPSSYVCATELWFGDLHRAASDLGCVLCLAELPNTQDKILEVACDIMEFAYFWFCNASG